MAKNMERTRVSLGRKDLYSLVDNDTGCVETVTSQNTVACGGPEAKQKRKGTLVYVIPQSSSR